MNRSIWPLLFVSLLLGAAIALPGCPKKEVVDSGEQAPPPPKSRFKGTTKAFVESLTAQPALVWPVADEGTPVVYDELFFSEDGTFRADTSVRFGGVDDEPFICVESGTWALDGDEAISKTVGNLTFEMTSTNCAGRTAPITFRAKATIDEDDIDLADR